MARGGLTDSEGAICQCEVDRKRRCGRGGDGKGAGRCCKHWLDSSISACVAKRPFSHCPAPRRAVFMPEWLRIISSNWAELLQLLWSEVFVTRRETHAHRQIQPSRCVSRATAPHRCVSRATEPSHCVSHATES